jgi:beta-galactosidase/beta-glucuronidase
MGNKRISLRLTLLLALVWAFAVPSLKAWEPAKGPLMTQWAADVSSKNPHPEYPRPQMTRKHWLNLNGLWDLAIVPKESGQPKEYSTKILVPFPVESALSGVMKPVKETEEVWYRRAFKVPRSWSGKRVLLNFGAVDFDSTVLVNGRQVGTHRGGYDAFSFDITDALKTGGENELVVKVWDPTDGDGGTQPRGKQIRKPHGIWYTSTSGIWQTVWIEPVASAHIKSLEITPDIDAGEVRVRPTTTATLGRYDVEATVYARSQKVANGSVALGGELALGMKNPKLWSPESPYLYRLVVTLKLGGRTIDRVESYFGMRKIALGKDANGFTRILLNNKPYFQFGPLDQGFWPDGLYAAPTDEALRYDIEMTKKFGFNMARKHVKVEPQRWYYWCDRLGLLVWQDMPSGDKYIGAKDPDATRTPESAAQFERELEEMITELKSHPSIVIWVPFNEGWGQYDTARITEKVKKLDSSRLVINTSGWSDRGVGDINDMHKYPGPGSPEPEEKRAIVLGEFGGLGLPVRGHTWQDEKNWGYRSFTDAESLTKAYLELVENLFPFIETKGLSAAVYTQTTDVEIEVNGLMTYDREVLKMDPKVLAPANRSHLR